MHPTANEAVHPEDESEIRVLITGFGQFLNIKTNPSWEIVSRLPPTLHHKWMDIRIITQQEPLKAAYHELLEVPALLEATRPDAVIHVGLDAERSYFAIEAGADRDGYHQFPDEARKVFTKQESKQAWGKSPARLDSALDLEDVLVKWRAEAGKGFDLRTSDDVGSYVCGFVYYTSMEWSWKRGGTVPVLFMHVPPLPGKDDIARGNLATLALIKAVAESVQK